jgi:hypothetical protein
MLIQTGINIHYNLSEKNHHLQAKKIITTMNVPELTAFQA